MPRGYRLFVATLAGLAALFTAFGDGLLLGASNQPQQDRYPSYQKTQGDAQRRTSAILPQPVEYQEPCQRPYGKDESELCAEWHSAKAGENSAFWAQWSFWIAVAGIIGLLFSLYYTRRAVEIAADATTDADEALGIARRNADAAAEHAEIARSAQRAWLAIEDIAVNSITYNFAELLVQLKNYGKTPAKFVTTAKIFALVEGVNLGKYVTTYDHEITNNVIAPGQVLTNKINTHIAELFQVQHGIVFRFEVSVQYTDSTAPDRRESWWNGVICSGLYPGGGLLTIAWDNETTVRNPTAFAESAGMT